MEVKNRFEHEICFIEKIENWCGHEIRFIERDGEWWAILKDICDALNLETKHVSERLETGTMNRVKIRISDTDSKGENKTEWMLVVNESGIYEALFASGKLEARKFRRWSANVLRRLRQEVGLEGYEVMHMTEPEIQQDIDDILDTLFYDSEKGRLMQSVTIQGGDVEQIPFDV